MKIAYKVIAVILALIIIPMVFFVPIAYVRAQSTALQVLAYFGEIKNNPSIKEYMDTHNGKLPEYVADDYAVADILNKSTIGFIENMKGAVKEKDNAVEKVVSPALTLATLLCLIMLCAVITAIFAIFAKDNRKVIYASMAGIGLSVMVKYAFEAVAKPFLDGRISLESIFDNSWLSLVGKIEEFSISSAFWFIPLVFLCLIIWTVLYNMTLSEADKKERKLILGEGE